MFKRVLWTGILGAGILFTIRMTQAPATDAKACADSCATCVGGYPCHACKNCRYCGHCAKGGGSCGVCR